MVQDIHTKIRKKINLGLLWALGFLFIFCVGCGSALYDKNKSPRFVDYAIESYNEGSLDTQFVVVSLAFDKPVVVQSAPADTLKATIAGNRVADKDWQWAVLGGNEIRLTFEVDGVNNGILEISPSERGDVLPGITDETGQYGVQPFELMAIIPSGVELDAVEETPADKDTPAQTVKEVKNSWSIRSITWILLLENGVIVHSEEQDTLEIMDAAVAVHGHDFLTATKEDVAHDLCETLTHYFGPDYSFTAKGTHVTVQKRDAAPGDTVDIQIYLGQDQRGSGASVS